MGENAMERWPTASATAQGRKQTPTAQTPRMGPPICRQGGRVSMISRTKWIAALGLGFLATPAWAQPNPGTTNFGSPQWETPFPFMWGQKDEGFYFATEAVAMRINSALR